MTRKIQTVLGQISPEELGVTLTHEHLSIDVTVNYFPPREEKFKNLDWTLLNIGWIRQNPYGKKDNLIMKGAETEEAVLFSVAEFKKLGGNAIVDNSVLGLHRRSTFLKEVAFKTGVHVIAGTGFYVDASIDQEILKYSEEEMSNFMMKELNESCFDESSIKCGMIGEIGISWPITEFEKKSIRASAKTQESVKCGVSFHPGRDPKAPAEIMRIFLEAGGKADKTVMSHLERTLKSNEAFHDFADLGCYCQLDLFGIETSYYQILPEIDFPSDAQRMDFVKFLLDDKRENKILISQDIHTKHRLERFGGHGYSHILQNVVPKMIAQKGINQSQLDSILIKNPAEFLAY